ncbi:KIN17-like protein [Linepithema humile]|uniref:KIN17-like protein n=1 Tax=Linepithema humile TaxID=83485 RepID=UPI00351E1DEC
MNRKSLLKNISSYSNRHRRRLRQEEIQLLSKALLDDTDSSPQTSSNVEDELLQTNKSRYDEINLQDNHYDNNDSDNNNEEQVQKDCETEVLWNEYEYEYLHVRKFSDSESSEQEDDINDEVANLPQFQEYEEQEEQEDDINDEVANLPQFQEYEEQEGNEPMKKFLID